MYEFSRLIIKSLGDVWEILVETTSVNLLRRLRSSDDDSAWTRFTELYVPLIFYWGRQHGLNSDDAADLVQDVLSTLVVKLSDFEYDARRRFRGWLHTMTLNRARDWERRQKHRAGTGHSSFMERLPEASQPDLFDEVEYRAYLVERARRLIAAEFEPLTWDACWKYVTEGVSAEQVAAELGISANAVRVAKCRVLKRLREELDGLLD
ncbi:MAG: sigma-70 family RNA polymerase sigma factor [Planctomyces sp.]|nr:sigma-70 family RNA polymerase sigma factor [Planctomyces sp.]